MFIFNDIQAGAELIESYDIDNLNLRAILFQTGYLTVKKKDIYTGELLLDYPNREVEQAMSSHILAQMLHGDPTASSVPVFNIKTAFEANDLEKVVQIINAMLKDVPYPLLKGKREDFYHALVHLHFRYLGLLMQSEVHTSDGRLDALVQTATHVYVIEFKLNQAPEIALQQIKDKGYAEKYRLDGRIIVQVGISFDTRRRAVKGWLQETL